MILEALELILILIWFCL